MSPRMSPGMSPRKPAPKGARTAGRSPEVSR